MEIYIDEEDKRLTASALGSSRHAVSPGKVMQCCTCGFGFRWLRPAEEELSSLYRELDSRIYEQEARGRFRTAARHLAIVRRCVSSGKLLDVGCASGAFLCRAVDAGWKVVGVEPAEVLSKKAQQQLFSRGEVICATLQQANLPDSYFDALTLWDVLEHVPDPVGFMKTCARLLKPGGHLFVNVPNLDSLQARLLGRWWPLLLAEHLNYFNRKSLRICAENAQLTLLHFGQRPASFSIEYILYRLAQHHIFGASFLRKAFRGRVFSELCIPIYLGEIYGIWRK